jgi:hypothetical protein
MDIDRIVTNIANAYMVRAQDEIRNDGIPKDVLDQYKNRCEREMVLSSAEEFHSRHKGISQWGRMADGSIRGTVSFVIMDEHEFRERIREALEVITDGLRPELDIVDHVDRKA